MEVRGTVRIPSSAAIVDRTVLKIALRPLDTLRYYAWADSSFLRSPLETTVNADGTFALTGVAPGEYVVLATLPSGLYVADILQGGRSVLESGLRLQPESREALEVILGVDGGSVDGILRNANGQSLAFRQVVLIPAARRRRAFEFYAIAKTDHRGRFAFLNLAPGEYKVFAWASIPDGAWTNETYLRAFEDNGTTVRATDGQRSTDVAVELISESP
jgi:hypothetical protein